MKKLSRGLILLLALALAFSMAGCGNQETAKETVVQIVSEVQAAAEQLAGIAEEAETAPVSEGREEPASVQEPEITEEPAEEQQSPGEAQAVPAEGPSTETGLTVTEDGEYSDKDHVALYLHTFGHLPSNYVTKKEARNAGWDSSAGNLYKVLPGKSIGGDRFGNYEGLLPEASGRKYYECDINYNPDGKTSGRVSRGAERIIFSNDGLIFYTDDHYNSFEQLY